MGMDTNSLRLLRSARTWIVTGACGYIGSHIVWQLIEFGQKVIGIDNLSSGFIERLHPKCIFLEGDIQDRTVLQKATGMEQISGIFNFAGLKYPEESFIRSEEYFRVNTGGVSSIIRFMTENSINILVQSSSCSVYGETAAEKVSESAPLRPISPYGQSKLEAEILVRQQVQRGWLRATNLRYFNVAGALNSRLKDTSKHNLFPKLLKSTTENGEATIYGNSYATDDGTCIRDYIHVEDLALGHILAADRLLFSQLPSEINLGGGRGFSVLEVIREFEKQLKIPISVKYGEARRGDPSRIVADIERARIYLDFSPRSTLSEMVKSTLAV